jgi:hypothetical protein
MEYKHKRTTIKAERKNQVNDPWFMNSMRYAQDESDEKKFGFYTRLTEFLLQ